MRGGAAVALAALGALGPVATAEPAPPRRAAWLALPSIDGLAGAEVGGELRIGSGLALAAELGARKSASGDYAGWTINAGGELRWYFRGGGGWAPRELDRAGWFTGGRVDVARAALRMAGRDLGAAWTLAAGPEVGYRIVPWRGLAITGLVTLEERVELGDLPTWSPRTFGFGLEVGWMF